MFIRFFPFLKNLHFVAYNISGRSHLIDLIFRLGLTFGDTNCAEKKVVRITCSNLECGVRPQANPQWGR